MVGLEIHLLKRRSFKRLAVVRIAYWTTLAYFDTIGLLEGCVVKPAYVNIS